MVAALGEARHGRLVSNSRSVLISLTRLRRSRCQYCGFTRPAHPDGRAILGRNKVLVPARAAAAGCREALFTLSDNPERRFPGAWDELRSLGHETTVSYLAEAAQSASGSESTDHSGGRDSR
jgi:FO synthase